MSTEFFNDQWRIPSNENQNKVSNYSMSFDGTSSYIDIDDYVFSGLTSFSISYWYNLNSISGDQAILAQYIEAPTNRGILLYHDDPNGWAFYINTDAGLKSFESTFTATVNTWQHLVVTYKSGVGIKIYLNGTAQSSGTLSGTPVNPTPSEFTIGRDGASGSFTRFFNGKIDQLSIFDYELSSTEVSTLYGGGTAVTNPLSLSPKPISYYQLGDQSVDNGANYLVPNNSLSDYVFNFSSSRIRLNSTSILQNVSSFTISTWANSNGSSSDRMIFGADVATSGSRGLYISARPNGQYKVLLSTDGTSNDQFVYSTSGSDNVWRNIIVNWNGTSINLFIDGVFVYTQAVVNSTGNFSIPIEPSIGAQNGTTSSFGFIGEISNVQIWDSILTSGGATVGQVAGGEIATIYNNSSPFQGTQPQVSNLKGWWKLNAADTFNSSTSTWTINDYGSGGNDGTSVGMDSSNLVVSDLQQTSGYSPYALDFDGIDDSLNCGNNNDLQATTALSISAWIKYTSDTANYRFIVSRRDSSNTNYQFYLLNTTGGSKQLRFVSNGGVDSTGSVTINNWHHVAVTANGGNISFYIDGQPAGTGTITGINSVADKDFIIGNIPLSGVFEFPGSISNVAVWNTDLSSSEINEIYNQGVPGNLHNFSGTAPVSWWQLGSNSSFNTNWTCLDEIGTNNAVSANMTNDDIVDGVGYSASGLGTSSIDIKGDAPYSTANGLSENMDVLDRTTDIPS